MWKYQASLHNRSRRRGTYKGGQVKFAVCHDDGCVPSFMLLNDTGDAEGTDGQTTDDYSGFNRFAVLFFS